MADNSLQSGSDTIRDIDRAGVKTQVVAIDGGGAAGESLVTPANPFPISVNAANFIFSTNNTSAVQLASGATFIGTIETALNQPSISILLTSDQPILLTIHQYIDGAGTQEVQAISWPVTAGVGFSQSVTLNGNYVKLTAQNTGTATTTTFSLNTAFGTIPSATASGSAPVTMVDSTTQINATRTSNGVLFTSDCSGYATLVCDIDPAANNVRFEASVDNTSWYPTQCYPVDQNLSPVEYVDSDGLVLIPAVGRYVRAVVFGYASGTVVAVGILKQQSMDAFCTANLTKTMDAAEGLQLHTRLIGAADRQVAQDAATGALRIGVLNPSVTGALNANTVGNTACEMDCDGYASATIYSYMPSGSPVWTPELLFPDGWKSINAGATNFSGGGGSYAYGPLLQNAGYVAATLQTFGAKRIRLRCTTSVAGQIGSATIQLSTIPYATAIQAWSGANGSMTVTASVSSGTNISTAAALADATANPTAGIVEAANGLFNGTTWDRQRNNAIVTMGDTGAKTATFNGATQTNYDAAGAYITAVIPTVSGTSPTLTAQLQFSPDGGTTWIALGPASTALTAAGNITFIVYPANVSQTAGATPANLTTGAAQTVVINAPLPRTWRLAYTIGGTTPSFTFTNVYADYIK